MLQTDKGRELIKSLPSETLLTETDGLFTQNSGRPSCPADVAGTVAIMADLRRMSWQEMAGIIRNDLKVLLTGPDAPVASISEFANLYL